MKIFKQNKIKFINKMLALITLALVLTMYVACGKVTVIKDLYTSPSAKNISIEGTIVDYNQRYIFISDGTGILNIKNEKNVEIAKGDTVKVSGKSKVVNKSFIIEDPSLSVLAKGENKYKVNAVTLNNDDIKKLKESEYAIGNKILFIGKATWVGETRGMVSKDELSYVFTTDTNKDFTMFSSSSDDGFRMGNVIKCVGYIVGVYDNAEEGKLGIEIEIFETGFSSFEDVSDSGDGFDLHILSINDLHGYIVQDENGSNGISNIAYLINQIRESDPSDDVILVANGDMFQGTAISNMTKGLSVLEAMNAMSFDCMGVGNHEFDWGFEEVLKYFDGEKDNGEANFPLLNSNIKTKDGSLVLDDNIVKSTIVEREGIKVGIIGYIGDVYDSINYSVAKDYYFETNVSKVVGEEAISLKEQGVDVIVVSVHGGNSSDIEAYAVNSSLANLTYQGEYLIDAVINGHTHSRQTGQIRRNNGVELPLVQAGCNGAGIGEIVLTINKDTKNVIKEKTNIIYAYSAYTNYDESVEKIIDDNLKKYENVLNEIYAIAGETVRSTSDYYAWAGDVLCKGTGADISICNTGGIRSTGDVRKGENITIENMYLINPFDNYVILVELSGMELKNLNTTEGYFSGGLNISSLDDSKTYKVAVIDYVYYKGSFPQKDNAINTMITMRDMLIEDLRLQGTFNPITNPISKLSSLIK